MKANTFRNHANRWPPYLVGGIHIDHLSEDYRQLEVSLSEHWYNRIHPETGGNLLGLTDDLYVVMLSHALGDAYAVWGKDVATGCLQPGYGKVTSSFTVGDALLEDIRAHTADGRRYHPHIYVDLVGLGGVVTQIKKDICVRRKSSLP